MWYRVLLRAFPSDFRRMFGAEVLQTLDAQRHAIDGGGLGARVQFHLEATADLLRALARERSLDLARAMGWCCLVLSTGNVAYDIAMPKLRMGWYAWALTLIVAAAGVILASPSPGRRRPG